MKARTNEKRCGGCTLFADALPTECYDFTPNSYGECKNNADREHPDDQGEPSSIDWLIPEGQVVDCTPTIDYESRRVIEGVVDVTPGRRGIEWTLILQDNNADPIYAAAILKDVKVGRRVRVTIEELPKGAAHA